MNKVIGDFNSTKQILYLRITLPMTYMVDLSELSAHAHNITAGKKTKYVTDRAEQLLLCHIATFEGGNAQMWKKSITKVAAWTYFWCSSESTEVHVGLKKIENKLK